MKNRKVLLLGLDGACFDFIDPLIKTGKLPTFKRLIDEGVRANLRSTIPPTTIPAWVSMFTGLSEGKLGCFGQQRWEKSSRKFKPVSILSWKGKLLWDIISERKRVGLFRMQTLSRSYPINGFMITDIYSWGGSSQGNVHPPDLFNELKDYWIDKETEDPILTLTQIKLAFKNFEKRIEAASYLLEHKEMDLFIMITRIPDIISHFTTNLRKVQLTYEIIDNGLSRLIDLAKNKNYNVIIVSDHGTGRQVNRRFDVNNWLATHGFLTKIGNRTQGTQKLSDFFVDKLTEFLRKRGLSPWLRSVYGFVEKKLSKKVYSSPSNMVEELIQWENTKAFSYEGSGTNYAGIQILRKELFSQGALHSDEYKDLRDELCDKLKRYKDPQTNKRVIDEIFLKEQIFHGDNMHLMPDIILKLKKNYVTSTFTSSSVSSVVSSDKELIHTESGVFIANGPIFKKGLKIADVNIVDIAPTLLYILDIPIPKDMDGNVLKLVFNEKSPLFEKEIEYQEPKKIVEDFQFTHRETEEIRDRLRALGYI